MLVAAYNNFVRETDQYADKPDNQRRDIALYGIVGELGSVVSAVKKKLLAEGGQEDWNHANEEIKEELGDVIWYCFSFSQIENKDRAINLLTHNIALLKKEIGASDEHANKIHAILDKDKKEEFLESAKSFPDTKDMCFDDYQKLAFLTARTHDKELLEICLAELWQSGAELLREKLPETERSLNALPDPRPINVILCGIAWYLAAIASIYSLSFDAIAEANVEKVSFRQRRHMPPTPLHDENDNCPDSQKFPRKFEIAFVTIRKGKSRMYCDGKQLGNDLTDNSYDDDGYRFHDVMHLANAATLGWSPVLRSLLDRKRKYDDKIDEVEDGARAKIVEEAIVKVIHSEGVRLAKERNPSLQPKPVRLFPTRDDVTFKFLKFIRNFVGGLEVEKINTGNGKMRS